MMPNKHQLLSGQILLIICFVLYLIWWYRGFRPGSAVSRVKGFNGLLLTLTAVTGIGGIALSLLSTKTAITLLSPAAILTAGAVGYIVLLLITRFLFNRIVTSELLLIVMWTMLEVWVINCLDGTVWLPGARFWIMCGMLAISFVISMFCYVAYYKMEEMKAFYIAMVPLGLGIVSMTVLMLMAR